MSPRSVLFAAFIAAAPALVSAQSATPQPAAAQAAPAGPADFQVKRAEKIAEALHLADATKTARVRDIIAQQYFDLSQIQAKHDDAIKAAKLADVSDKKAVKHAIKQAEADADAAELALHPRYLACLATELTPAQIDEVKEGMTYGVLTVTYRVYQQMLPDLTAEQKAQILAWLTEARERAMDAGTSKEKHAWFGKYKGRINIYLTKQGYNMKEAEKRLFAKH